MVDDMICNLPSCKKDVYDSSKPSFTIVEWVPTEDGNGLNLLRYVFCSLSHLKEWTRINEG